MQPAKRKAAPLPVGAGFRAAPYVPMPIYEFYCADCHTLFNFLARTVDTAARPACPRCGRPRLERRPARFATLDRSGRDGDVEAPPVAGDERLEAAFAALADEMGDAPEGEDPRILARAFRRFGDRAGLEPASRLEEVLQRLEAGEDPDALEAEMEGLAGASEGSEDLTDLFRFRERSSAARRRRQPDRDDTLYFL